MRDWLSDPPDGVTVREDLDGVTITIPASSGLTKHVVELIGILVMAPLVMGGAVAGVLPWMGVLEGGALMFILGFAGACVTMVIGLLLGFFTAAGLQMKLEDLAGVHRERSVTIREHTIHLHEESVTLSEALFVDGDAEPALVLRGGRRAAIVPGAAEAHRRWLAGLLGALVRQRSEGSEEDIPEALHQLKRPGQPIRSG